uniref:DNA replication licensing factor MCM3 n=1 Tax=Trichogramma kaykai TaxID=54128 RepID=A0ABD2WQ51_9HYME
MLILSMANTEFFIGFEESFGSKHKTPRTVTSIFVGNMLCVEGIVVRLRPKVVKRVQLSKATQTASERAYSDSTSFDAFPATSVYPTQEDDGNPLEIEYGLSTYQNHQTLTIQEMPEKAPAGQLPRTIEIILDNDLVHLCKPDDRVQQYMNVQSSDSFDDINIVLIVILLLLNHNYFDTYFNIPPQGITTTGRDFFLCLTAAVTADTETGKRRLEAGAMVFVNR